MSVNKQIYCIKYQAKCIYVSKETHMIQKEIRLCSGHLSINLIPQKEGLLHYVNVKLRSFFKLINAK
jgi:hypothetical protein